MWSFWMVTILPVVLAMAQAMALVRGVPRERMVFRVWVGV